VIRQDQSTVAREHARPFDVRGKHELDDPRAEEHQHPAEVAPRRIAERRGDADVHRERERENDQELARELPAEPSRPLQVGGDPRHPLRWDPHTDPISEPNTERRSRLRLGLSHGRMLRRAHEKRATSGEVALFLSWRGGAL
jgi:hypothetical protein